MESPVTFRFVPEGFRALAPPQTGADENAANKVGDQSGADAAVGAAAKQAVKSL
jgi:hypothetical protein